MPTTAPQILFAINDDDSLPCSLQAIQTSDQFSPDELRSIEALDIGQTLTGGGGGWAEWSVRRLQ